MHVIFIDFVDVSTWTLSKVLMKTRIMIVDMGNYRNFYRYSVVIPTPLSAYQSSTIMLFQLPPS